MWKQRSMLLPSLFLLVSSMWGQHEMILSTFRLGFAFSVKSLWSHPHWHNHRCVFQWVPKPGKLTRRRNPHRDFGKLKTLLLNPYSANWNIVTEALLHKLKHCYRIPTPQTETLLLNLLKHCCWIPCPSRFVYSRFSLLPQIVTVSSALQAFVVCLMSLFTLH